MYERVHHHSSIRSIKMADDCSKNSMKNVTKIGSYKVGKTVGKGNFAVVKSAEHESCNATVSCINILVFASFIYLLLNAKSHLLAAFRSVLVWHVLDLFSFWILAYL